MRTPSPPTSSQRAQLPVRVMIVEDSPVVRQLLTHIIGRDPRLAVVAALGSAEEALHEIGRVRPDVISMDIRLPGIDGLEATRRIMAEHPTPIVVISETVEDEALKISMNALRAGALSVVEKPVGVSNANYDGVADTICTQLYIMSEVPVIRRRPLAFRTETSSDGLQHKPLVGAAGRPRLVAMAASTGGPAALAKVLGALPAHFPLPVVVVQHMGAPFMEGFAAWLDGVTPLKVAVARDRMEMAPGHVHIAPGDKHLMVTEGGVLRLGAEAPLRGQRPSATLLFRSVARAFGAAAVGVLLTGMGEDGAEGLAEMRAAGAYTIAEDESSAVVYGMPAAAARLGAARMMLPIDKMADDLLRVAEREKRS